MRILAVAESAVLLGLGALMAVGPAAAQQPDIDITRAIIVAADRASFPIERKAAVMLKEEVEKRSGVSWPLRVGGASDPGRPVIWVGSLGTLSSMGISLGGIKPAAGKDRRPAKDGYILATPHSAEPSPEVLAVGNDRRGALFAVGRLLRAMSASDGKVLVPAGLSIATAPAYPIRGHHLGHDSGNDTTDAWNMAQYEQYLRDLIVFGANSFEMSCSVDDDDGDLDPVMRMSSLEWVVRMCALLDSYDIDAWVWLSLKGGTVEDPQERKRSLQRRDRLFASCKRIDHVFVPGGDPGNTPPQVLMPYLAEVARVLRKRHPRAGLWVSTQGFESKELAYLYRYLRQRKPAWLTGVVYGPWTHDTLQHTRAAVPRQYQIRLFSDITHTIKCEYPVPNWDQAWARTYERQPIMPVPTQSAHTCTFLAPYTAGAIPYSEGTGDDVNKAIWSALLWDPKAQVRSVLVDYGRCFIGAEFAEDVADGLLALEKDWTGPALSNPHVPQTLAHWQAMDARASRTTRCNWRLQQFLLRAHVDAYVQRRLQRETDIMGQAKDLLRKFLNARQSVKDADAAMDAAEALLDSAEPVSAAAPELRPAIEELAAALKHSIGMQLGAIYGANAPERGALLDTMDAPITDAPWYREGFAVLRAETDEKEKFTGLRKMLDWEDPGPGGFYDDLGNGANGKQPHLITAPGWQKDPGFILSPKDEHGGPATGRLSWRTQAETLYGAPLRLRYEGLDPDAAYLLKATYAGRYRCTLQLSAGGRKIGQPVRTPAEGVQVEFEIPKEATADGVLELRWDRIEGRGTQVAEVWLMKR